MTTTITVLDTALDAAAPTQELWLAGKAAYLESIDSDSDDTKKAYYAALDAAAPDEDSWIAGRDALVLNGVRLLPSPSKVSFKDRLMSRKTQIRVPKGGVVFGVVIGILIGIVAAFAVGLLVNNVLSVLNPILWLIQLLLVVGGATFGYRIATKPKESVNPVH